MVRQLDLSDAQREQLRRSWRTDARTVTRAPGSADAERSCMRRCWPTHRTAGSIQTLKAAITAAHTAELDHRIETMQKVAQILTPAQRQQLLKLRPRRQAAAGYR